MQSRLLLGLTAVTLAIGMMSASAAPISAFKSSVQPSNLMAPQGGSASGFVAIKSAKTNDLKAAANAAAARSNSLGLARPDASHAWGNGLSALAAVTPHEFMASTAMQAMSPQQGMAATANGFAAIKKAPSGLHGVSSASVDSFRASGTTSAFVNNRSSN